MKLWQDAVIALLAATGLAALLWAAARALLFSRPARPFRAMALVPAAGDGETLEAEIRSLAALAAKDGHITRVLIADCGLSEEGRQLCRLLARDSRWVVFCTPDRICDHLPPFTTQKTRNRVWSSTAPSTEQF